MDLQPLGDRAWLASFDSVEEARAFASALETREVPGLLDIVLAYHRVAIHADPDLIDVGSGLPELLMSIAPGKLAAEALRQILVPTLYDGDDLDEVARTLGLSVEEIVDLHSRAEFVVQAVGFLPGFPYAGDLPRQLDGLPRRNPPRIRVPAGSVAIVGRQTCVYPGESPGGWHLIGRTPLTICDPDADFFPIRAGNRLRFLPITRPEFHKLQGTRICPGPST